MQSVVAKNHLILDNRTKQEVSYISATKHDLENRLLHHKHGTQIKLRNNSSCIIKKLHVKSQVLGEKKK